VNDVPSLFHDRHLRSLQIENKAQQFGDPQVEYGEINRNEENRNDDHDAVTRELTAIRPFHFLQFRPAVRKKSESRTEPLFQLCKKGHGRTSIPLPRFAMNGMFIAKLAVLLQLHAVRMGTLIFTGRIVSLFASDACQRDDYPHDDTSQANLNQNVCKKQDDPVNRVT
jgi:hypothetical protein